jgi:hypothetical protein
MRETRPFRPVSRLLLTFVSPCGSPTSAEWRTDNNSQPDEVTRVATSTEMQLSPATIRARHEAAILHSARFDLQKSEL